ncbi:amidase [Ancylobacter sp. A5.8]|uniref:amidase n=1 Tax=Ancylobacter gelatini TaxID=2919920 RepID=UPI001F4DA478|nr:amidase [Ancylobacter gelatini]MCJ8142337.1 amidase [Ancylobacter gelatini]
MATSELWRLSAEQLSAGLDARDIRVDDLIETALERAQIFDERLNIFTCLDTEGARGAAEAAQERQQRGARLGPLDGVPVTVKDNLFVGGLPARWGSRLFASHVAPCDDIVVERLRAAGAVILGKTTTPEFALGLVTASPISGITRNPWNPELTPGGSSGGAMAALATGIAPLAVGTDAGGSIRMPASFTNMVGLRPSNGRVPRRFGFPTTAHDFQSIGLAARTVEDVAMLYDAVSGPDRRDPASMRLSEPQGGSRQVIGWMTELPGEPIEKEVVQAVEQAAETLRSIGYTIRTVPPPFDPVDLRDIWSTITSASVARIVQLNGTGHVDELSAPMRALYESGNGVSAAELVATFDRLSAFRARVNAAWNDWDVLLLPTAPAPAWPIGLPCPVTIDGRTDAGASMGNYCGWVNALGFPAMNVPGPAHPDGRPIGVQLVARFGDDASVLSVGHALSQALDLPNLWAPLC